MDLRPDPAAHPPVGHAGVLAPACPRGPRGMGVAKHSLTAEPGAARAVPGPLWRARDRLDEIADLLLGDLLRDVGLADDADQGVAVDHRKTANLVFCHHVQGLVDRVIRADRHWLSLA